MTAALSPDRRTTKAAGIIARNECTLLECGAVRVVDTQTGSGTPHYVINGVCDCTDYRRGNRNCKHCIAAAAELARYATIPSGPVCPTCGAATYADMFYVAGSYRSYRICTADKYHKATRLN